MGNTCPWWIIASRIVHKHERVPMSNTGKQHWACNKRLLPYRKDNASARSQTVTFCLTDYSDQLSFLTATKCIVLEPGHICAAEFHNSVQVFLGISFEKFQPVCHTFQEKFVTPEQCEETNNPQNRGFFLFSLNAVSVLWLLYKANTTYLQSGSNALHVELQCTCTAVLLRGDTIEIAAGVAVFIRQKG